MTPNGSQRPHEARSRDPTPGCRSVWPSATAEQVTGGLSGLAGGACLRLCAGQAWDATAV